jgi:hypothetical protein
MHSDKMAIWIDAGLDEKNYRLWGWYIARKDDGQVIDFVDGRGKGAGLIKTRFPGILLVDTRIMVQRSEYYDAVEYFK